MLQTDTDIYFSDTYNFQTGFGDKGQGFQTRLWAGLRDKGNEKVWDQDWEIASGTMGKQGLGRF